MDVDEDKPEDKREQSLEKPTESTWRRSSKSDEVVKFLDRYFD